MKISEVEIPVKHDIFLGKLIRELSGTLEDVVGLEEASGFVSIVGQRLGNWMDENYRKALHTDRLTPEQIPEVLIDLKRRIHGDFFLISEDAEKIVLGNRRCPFGSNVEGRRSMCMMTSNVFGTITAENLGYARVCLHKTLATGSDECRVVVYKQKTAQSEDDEGREYYQM